MQGIALGLPLQDVALTGVKVRLIGDMVLLKRLFQSMRVGDGDGGIGVAVQDQDGGSVNDWPVRSSGRPPQNSMTQRTWG